MSRFEGQHYASHDAFYRAVYDRAIMADRSVSGITLMESRQTAGDWSDAATPDLVISRVIRGRGSGIIDLGAGRFMSDGRLEETVVVPPLTATSFDLHDAHWLRFMCIPWSRVQGLTVELGLPKDGDFGSLHTRTIYSDFLRYAVDSLWNASDWTENISKLFVDSNILGITAHLLSLSGDVVPRRHHGGLSPWQLRRALELLEASDFRSVSLTELAAAVGLSPFHFARAFRQTVGVPPHRHQMLRRVERACDLLASSSLSVTEIALEVGYESPQSLARVFGAEMGMSPAAWRRERRR